MSVLTLSALVWIGKIIGRDRWDIQSKIASVTTDSAQVMISTARMLQIPHYPCIAHVLHNTVKKAMEGCTQIGYLTTKCHIVVLTFHNSPKMAQFLATEQQLLDNKAQPLVVVLDVVTRWNSMLRMLERLVRLREPLDALWYSAEHDKLDADRDVLAKFK